MEQAEIFLETAVDALLVEGQEFEVFRFDREDARGDERGVDLRVLGGDFIGVVGKADGEEVVFDGAAAVETPAIGRYALGELEFEGPFGHHGCDEGGGELVVGNAIFVGHGGYLAGQIVTAGVEAGVSFAFFGFGAG